jgi:hypothetical protein
MLLILTSSFDISTDLILDRLSDIPVFRFNIDLWSDYRWYIDRNGYKLTDPTGRQCEENAVRAVYLRKLLFNPPYIDVPAGGNEESWTRHQLEAVWKGIRDLAWHAGKLALVHPSTKGPWSKMRQMRVAARFFCVPDWVAHCNSGYVLPEPVVAKTFVPAPVGGGSILPVVETEQSRLSSRHPWFLQSKVRGAAWDVTVAWVNGRCFAYSLDRSLFEGPDCRPATYERELQWPPCELSRSEQDAIAGFMEETGYQFGRLDFLRSADGTLWFLELNPNGQFAWLDFNGENGLLDAIALEVRGLWERNKAT